MRKLFLLLASLLALAACGEQDPPEVSGEPLRYTANLRPLNDTEVDGTARMSLAGKHLTVDIDARGLARRQVHPQHIHGVLEEEEASCPESEADQDGDGYVDLDEGKEAFGGEVWALEPYPTVNRSGRLDWDLTITVDPERLRGLERRVVVLRGMSADLDGKGRKYESQLPVACGELEPVRATEGS